MADKKLNEVTKVTDMAYVPVIMADGSIGQIAKADLASVVAEHIKNSRIEILPKISNPKDFDTCSITGVYMCGGTAASNAPTSSPFGTLVVFSYSSGDNGYTVQLFLIRSS